MLISEIDGTRILFEDGPRELVDGDEPVRFAPGWYPVLAYTGLVPLTIVPFEHESGGHGVWFLDEEMRRCGGSVAELPAARRSALVAALCPLLDGIWQQLMLSETPASMTEAQVAFFFLPEPCRMMLLDLYLSTFDARAACRDLNQVGVGVRNEGVLDCGTRRVPLVGGELHWLSDSGLLQRLFARLPSERGLAFRSPCDGSVILCRKSIVLETDLVAYKLYDQTWDLSVFLLAGGIYNRTQALYFPEANLVLSHDPAAFAAAHPNLAAQFHLHLIRHGMTLFSYLASDGMEPVHFWRGLSAIHLGHVLWNDYSGIARMIEQNPGRRPRVLVCDAGAEPEMYGPLDRIFPLLKGRVQREDAPLMGLLQDLYEDNALLFRTSGMSVTRALRDRILATVPAKSADAPVLLLGLRTENRTASDLPALCNALVGHLAAGPGPVTLVVDGHNSREDGELIRSHGELGAGVAPIEAERALVEVIRAAAVGTQVSVVSTIGAPLGDSLGWARTARAFVAFWGAGLAKYRWVCNRPGLVITSRRNLETLGDLHIYSRPDTMQDPTPLSFVSPDAILDRPEAPVMIRHGADLAPSLWNFDIDIAAFLRDIDAEVAPLLFPAE